jgi:peroxiredoxin
VHSCNDSDHSRDSAALTETWTSQFDEEKNSVLNVVPPLSIDVCLLVVAKCPKLAEKKGHSNVVHMVKPKHPCWSNAFSEAGEE